MKVRKGVKSAVELKGAPSKHQQPSAHRAYLLNVPAGQEIVVSIADVADLAEMQPATVQVAAAPWPPVTEAHQRRSCHPHVLPTCSTAG